MQDEIFAKYFPYGSYFCKKKCNCGNKCMKHYTDQEKMENICLCLDCIEKYVYVLCQICREVYAKVEFLSKKYQSYKTMDRCEICTSELIRSHKYIKKTENIKKFIKTTVERYPIWKGLHIPDKSEFKDICKFMECMDVRLFYHKIVGDKLIFDCDQTKKLIETIEKQEKYKSKFDRRRNLICAIVLSCTYFSSVHPDGVLIPCCSKREIVDYEKILLLWNNLRLARHLLFTKQECNICFEEYEEIKREDEFSIPQRLRKINLMICSFCRICCCNSCKIKYYGDNLLNKECFLCKNKFSRFSDFILTKDIYLGDIYKTFGSSHWQEDKDLIHSFGVFLPK